MKILPVQQKGPTQCSCVGPLQPKLAAYTETEEAIRHESIKEED